MTTWATLLGDRPGYSTFAASLFDTARTVVDPFQSPVLRAMFAPWVLHLGRTPDEIGGGIWVKLAILALMGSGMPIPEGGSEMLARALEQLVVDQGGVIRTNTQVSRIIVENGRLRVIRMLVKSGFSLMAILRMLQQFDSGNTKNLREALSVPMKKMPMKLWLSSPTIGL